VKRVLKVPSDEQPTAKQASGRRCAGSASSSPAATDLLSGWSPEYFPPLLVQYVDTFLKEKALFGSDLPLITEVTLDSEQKVTSAFEPDEDLSGPGGWS
jgi:hypothetical protein